MSKLLLIPTPIGNLEDITLRALRMLKEADLILAEDTRKSAILLQHYDIKVPLKSYHMHNEHKSLDQWVERLAAGERIALISDAGTPAISDPGFLLLRECVRRGIEVECLPGPTALIPALVSSGLPADRFAFEGFLPPKKGRQTRLEALASESRTLIFYESPMRLVKTLQQIAPIFGPDRKAAVCREISKIHEEVQRGTLQELIDYYTENPPRGEIVVVVAAEEQQKTVKKNRYRNDQDSDEDLLHENERNY